MSIIWQARGSSSLLETMSGHGDNRVRASEPIMKMCVDAMTSVCEDKSKKLGTRYFTYARFQVIVCNTAE